MAIPPLLVWNNTGTPRAYRLLNGTTLESTQLGAATGFTAAVLDLEDGRLPHCRIIEFKRNLFLIHRGAIYKFDHDTKTWVDQSVTLTSFPTSDDQSASPLRIIDVDGVATLIGFYNAQSSTNFYSYRTTDGENWTLTFHGSNGASWPRYVIPYQGKLWVAGRAASDIVWSFDPASNARAPYTISGVTSNRNGFLINFQGRLFWLGTHVSGGARQPLVFQELVGGGFVDVTYTGTDGGDMVAKDSSTAGSVGMFEDNGRLYAVFWNMINDTTAGQMQVHEFIPNGTTIGSSFEENDISTTVIPSAWLTGGAFANTGSISTNVNVYVDVSTPESPEIFWWRYDDIPAGASTFWTWNGPSSLCTVENSVGSDYAIPQGPNSTGEYVFTEGDFDVTLDNPTTRPGYVDFDFELHDPLDGSSIPTKSGRLYYSIGGADWTLATLSTLIGDAPTFVNPSLAGTDPAPTVTTDTTGTVLQDIPIGHKFKATWDSTADGFTVAGTQFELMLEIF
jgi:hypothetical protein